MCGRADNGSSLADLIIALRQRIPPYWWSIADVDIHRLLDGWIGQCH